MLSKERVFIVSSNVDDSIRGVAVYCDVKLFKTFQELESYVEVTPIDIETLIINSADLPFTNNSMQRIGSLLKSVFVNINGSVYYLVDSVDIKSKVEEICKRSSIEKMRCVYRPTLHASDVASILTGEALSSKETVTEIRTYRVRASEYIRNQQDKEGLNLSDVYETDEDILSNIPDVPIPNDLRVDREHRALRHTVCSDSVLERALWSFLKAQYLALNGKTLLMERDYQYHTLGDLLTKSEVKYDYYDIEDMFKDCSEFISRIRASQERLIFVGSKHRIEYNYDFILDILVANLSSSIDHYIYECGLKEIPYSDIADVVMPATVPDILMSINKLGDVASYADLHFVGLDVTNLGSVNVSEAEYSSILQSLLRTNDIHCVVVGVTGTCLRKEVGLGGVFMHDKYYNAG